MNKKNLELLLQNNKVPKDCYSLNGGFPNEALVLKKSFFHWEVYYSERGKKTELQKFKREEDACLWFCQVIQNMLHHPFNYQ